MSSNVRWRRQQHLRASRRAGGWWYRERVLMDSLNVNGFLWCGCGPPRRPARQRWLVARPETPSHHSTHIGRSRDACQEGDCWLPPSAQQANFALLLRLPLLSLAATALLACSGPPAPQGTGGAAVSMPGGPGACKKCTLSSNELH